MDEMLKLALGRRSIRVVGADIPQTDDTLQKMLGELMLQMPTAMNMQSTRMVLLLGAQHKKLWQIVHDTLQAHSAKGVSAATAQKLAGFAGGHGTLLFFDESAITKAYAEKMPTYKENFIPWALQQNGMLQFAVWAALSEKGLGASLQHYNPLIDEQVCKTWDLPESWVLYAQMPFGKPEEVAGEKTFEPLEKRFLVFAE